MTLKVRPITADAFAPFGEVLVPPTSPSRDYFSDALANLRPAAPPNISLARIEAAKTLPLTMTEMERHEFSSQTFIPMGLEPYLVVVARHGSDGRPDVEAACAFLAEGGTGITYRANVWHHPMTVLAPATFAIVMWADGTEGDEEFVDVAPTLIEAP